MSAAVITVQGLSKRYELGETVRMRKTFREMVADRMSAALGSNGGVARRDDDRTEFWALRDVSFEVRGGEALAIIGRNGAGKSTLLKILSRVTAPTTGRIEVVGRVASLLEVGTGFHPELTGRENILLNGAILGMSRAEILRKFDEIVTFAEVEKFIDTPVKRYSSGMYVRLAFSVAAHLEPDIFVVDEVLAVGDTEFQRRCFNKMGDIAKQESRTVLFISHNMATVQALCDRGLYLDKGRVTDVGDVRSVVQRYFAELEVLGDREISWEGHEAPGNAELRLRAVRLIPNHGGPPPFPTSQPPTVEMEFELSAISPLLCVGFDLKTEDGTTVFRTYQTDLGGIEPHLGLNTWRCRLPAQVLNGGRYFIAPRIGVHRRYWIVESDPVLSLQTVIDHSSSDLLTSYLSGGRPGTVAPMLRWQSGGS